MCWIFYTQGSKRKVEKFVSKRIMVVDVEVDKNLGSMVMVCVLCDCELAEIKDGFYELSQETIDNVRGELMTFGVYKWSCWK